jgi:hypothetical protein
MDKIKLKTRDLQRGRTSWNILQEEEDAMIKTQNKLLAEIGALGDQSGRNSQLKNVKSKYK